MQNLFEENYKTLVNKSKKIDLPPEENLSQGRVCLPHLPVPRGTWHMPGTSQSLNKHLFAG